MLKKKIKPVLIGDDEWEAGKYVIVKVVGDAYNIYERGRFVKACYTWERVLKYVKVQ